MAVARLGSITLDCDDIDTLAAFWAGMLGGTPVLTNEKFIIVQLPEGYLTAHRVPGYRPPTWPEENPPKQIHLDLAVDDLETAQAAAIALGASPAAHQANPEVCRVLFDPAGHPFCLSLPIGRLVAARRGG
ncbi:VOC family protein [Nocardia sp. 2]|uniref:VOC family protein n=1 Tax=Nocardia acididurans TaxID=2802282 RepID=A0ABS1ME14_9NOCA|nr:VOC family protein [Nocardia acididurans]MBL1078806.1 VOC family protein [Nocardia acididurans]